MKRLAALFFALATPAAACDLELVLAMDVSRSVSTREYQLQTGGLAEALRNPEVIEAIRFLPGGVMATVMIWGDASQQCMHYTSFHTAAYSCSRTES